MTDDNYHPFAHVKAIEDLLITTMAAVIAQAPPRGRTMLQSAMLHGGVAASSDQRTDASDPHYQMALATLQIRNQLLAQVSARVDMLTGKDEQPSG